MILRTTLLMCAMVIAVLARGQTISPEVQGAAGTQSQVGNTIVTWTVGEPLTETLSASGNTITQGFHQPRYVLIALDEPLIAELGIKVYPNPTSDHVFMDIEREEESELTVELIDMTGRILSTRKSILMQDQLRFDLSQVAKGYYFLRVIQANGHMFKAYKVDKVY